MKVLVDADIVAYRCAATVDSTMEKDVAFYRMDVLLQQILEATESDSRELWLTGSDNFRKQVNPDYKANRKDTVPPCYLQDCREYLITNHGAKVSHGCEADDMLGLGQTDDTIIATIDKDLLMIPGKHYNWVKMTISDVPYLDGLKHFYKQMLIGDRSDNITGVNRVGPVKAEKYITPLDNEQDMLDVVCELYNDPSRFIMNAACLWIQQKEEKQTWMTHAKQVGLILNSDLSQEAEAMLKFMKSLKETT